MFNNERIANYLKTTNKNNIILILLVGILVSMFPSICFGESSINVYVDGQKVNFSQAPVTVNGKTLVQMKPIFEAMGIQVEWNQEKQQTTAHISDELTAIISVGYSNVALNYVKSVKEDSYTKTTTEYLNVGNDVNAQVINGSTMVSVRLVGELAGYDVVWDNRTKTININKNNNRKFAVVTVGSAQEGFDVGFANYAGYGIGDGTYIDGKVQFVPNGIGKIRYFSNYELTGISNSSGKINSYGYLKNLKDNTYTYGNFKNNVREGYGEEYYKDGSLKFKGTFKNNLYSKGTYHSLDNDVFTGTFDAEGNYGYGTLTEGFTSNVYTGSFYNGEFHGKGTYTFAGGTKVLSGSWNMGKYVGN